MRQTINFRPTDIETSSLGPDDGNESSGIHSRLAFVQVGVWELRRRWLSGETAEIDNLLASLDEDVERLRQALDTPAEEEDAVMI